MGLSWLKSWSAVIGASDFFSTSGASDSLPSFSSLSFDANSFTWTLLLIYLSAPNPTSSNIFSHTITLSSMASIASSSWVGGFGSLYLGTYYIESERLLLYTIYSDWYESWNVTTTGLSSTLSNKSSSSFSSTPRGTSSSAAEIMPSLTCDIVGHLVVSSTSTSNIYGVFSTLPIVLSPNVNA